MAREAVELHHLQVIKREEIADGVGLEAHGKDAEHHHHA
jgi:hypothetical protein